jgi:hypothetical protein
MAFIDTHSRIENRPRQTPISGMRLPKFLYEIIPFFYLVLGAIGIFSNLEGLEKLYGCALIASGVYIIRLRASKRNWWW